MGSIAPATATTAHTGVASAPRVLVLASYHQGNPWTDSIIKEIQNTIGHAQPDVEIHVEYMDSMRNDPRDVFPFLEPLYRSKYLSTPPNAIIAVDDEALNFLVARRNRLFHDVPIIFCAINASRKLKIKDGAEIVGITEDVDMRRTIELALSLHPKTKRIVGVSDLSSAAWYDFESFWRIFPDFEDRVRFDGFVGYSAEGLEAELAQLPKNTIILDVAFRRDRHGRVFSPLETVKLLSHNGDFPVYSLWDYYVGLGVVGGFVASGRRQGEEAARRTLRILNSLPAEADPAESKSRNLPMFDFVQLQHFGIPMSALPKGSIVINQPESFYWQYRYYIWGITSAFAGLVTLVLILLSNILQKRQAFHALKASQLRYRAIVEDQTEFLLRFDKMFKITYANSALCAFLRSSRERVLEQNLTQFIPAARFRQLLPMISSRSAEAPLFHGEERVRSADGSLRWIKWTGRAIFGPDEMVVEYQVVGGDITSEKQANQALEKSREAFRDLAAHGQNILEKERSRIALEIHDELGQNLTALNIGLSILGQGLSPSETTPSERIRDMRELTERTIGSVQRISQELRPPQLDELGLVSAMQWHARKFLGAAGLDYRFEKGNGVSDIPLDKDRATALFRVYQESLTNIIRHAAATHVTIRISATNGIFELEIIDDGIGIDCRSKRSRNSLGIMGMRERIRAFQGRLNVSGRSNQGTTVSVRLPVADAKTMI
ncbi:MAG: PAS domain S-box protein [Rhodospirillaceae bacterium]|nr:PAS domain S-box protein [Rhodospirillaceae bacterium]